MYVKKLINLLSAGNGVGQGYLLLWTAMLIYKTFIFKKSKMDNLNEVQF